MMKGHRFGISRHLVSEMPAEALRSVSTDKSRNTRQKVIIICNLLGWQGEIVFDTYNTSTALFPGVL